MYSANGSKVIFTHHGSGETRVTATCDNATRCAELLNRARHANDAKRQYTKAARLIAEAMALPGYAEMDL